MKKRILVAPLNWGIGHATRCIPLINALLINGYEPIIASDGQALLLLKKEFPNLICITLSGYNVKYAKNSFFFKWVLFWQSRKIISAITTEKEQIDSIIDEYSICGILSDNRFGVRSNKVPSVFMTHQLNVLSGNTSKMTSLVHQQLIKKFDAIWVPDFEGEFNLSGKLGHLFPKKKELKIKYIGPLSRMIKKTSEKQYDIMVLLSGPEPQRGLLEKKLFTELEDYHGSILFVKGEINTHQTISKQKQFTIYNFMTSHELETAINESNLIISRSGYTTIMDLAVLEQRAFFIPTPGQVEQEYLASILEEKEIAPYCKQSKFNLKKLELISNYNGFKKIIVNTNYNKLFAFFESK